MKDVKEALDKLVPEPARMADWNAVRREARPRGRSPVLQLAVATAIAGLAALFVVAPWKASERVGILDKALAAVGDGPVLHVVLRGDWGGTLVDLKTGERKPIYGERELWYSPDRQLVRNISRFGDVVDHDDVYRSKQGDRELKALWQDYRGALERGTARVAGQDVVGGVRVYWVIVYSEMLPDVADNKDHELAQQVAISRETYKPVAMKYTRDRHSLQGSIEHILLFETVSLDEADFEADPAALPGMGAMMEGSDEIVGIAQAAKVLGRAPFWLGSEYAGLPLAQARRAISATGTSEETLVTGPRAAQIRRCLSDRAPRTRPRTRAPRKCPRTRGGILMRDGDIYEMGPAKFGPRHTGISLFYGSLGDDPTTFKKDIAPLMAEPHVVITQTLDRELLMRGAPMKYVPPEGSVLLMAGISGYLVSDGVYITIQDAGSNDQILDIARALRPMPSAGSGAGG